MAISETKQRVVDYIRCGLLTVENWRSCRRSTSIPVVPFTRCHYSYVCLSP